jgi:5-methylcytosine-specific restriction enzyme B
MSRFNTRDISQILDAVEKWKSRCLVDGISIFGEKNIWIDACFEQLNKYYVENPDEGEGSFTEKLSHQLDNASPESKQLAAEILWALYLFPSNFGAGPKRKTVLTIWELSGEKLPQSHWALKNEVLSGIGSGSMSFTTSLWREFRGAILLLHDFIGFSVDERKTFLADPLKMAEWMDSQEATINRPFRHTFLYLMFPDYFERICSTNHKKEIVSTFCTKFGLPFDLKHNSSIDKYLYDIRSRIELEYAGKPVDFYLTPWKAEWQKEKIVNSKHESKRANPVVNEKIAEPRSAYSDKPEKENPLNLILYGPPGTGKTTSGDAQGARRNRF